MNTKNNKDIFSSLFIPHYDELSLFIMGYVCLLLLFFNNPPSKWDFSDPYMHMNDMLLLSLIFLPLIMGLFLCLYHAFTDRQKTTIEKKLMIFFAAIINGFSGLWYGTYILVHNSGWALSLFPIWNIISGYILISSLRAPDIEELTISDENVSFNKVIAGTIAVTLIFLICHIGLELVWAGTFSICVIWATNINSSLLRLFPNKRLR